MIQKAAWAFGILFIGAGILGFVPGVTENGELLGVFDVGLVHNLVHIFSGALALAAAAGGNRYARLFFRWFGVCYGLFTIAGFLEGSSVLGLFGVNMADNLLHLSVSFAALGIGFLLKESAPSMAMAPAPKAVG